MNTARLLQWYDQNARDLPWRVSPADIRLGKKPDPYRVWLSEIMLQQTTVGVVKNYYIRFLQYWPNVHKLAAAPLEEVLKLWAGLGYYARATNLHACANVVSTQFDGIFPTDNLSLQQLPGIGPYTGAAISAICFDQKVAVVDGNVERVSARLTALQIPPREVKKEICKFIQNHVPTRAGDFAQAIMDLGATVCTPGIPQCGICPLKSGCAGFASGNPATFPIRAKKKKRPHRYGHAFVVQRRGEQVFLQKRGSKGLLAKMSEVPNSSWDEKQSKVIFPTSGNWTAAGTVVHIFTHFRLELEVWYLMDCDGMPDHVGWWVAPQSLEGEALPSLFKKVIAKVISF